MVSKEDLGLRVNVAEEGFDLYLLAVDDGLDSLNATVENLEDITSHDTFNNRYRINSLEIFSTRFTSDLREKIEDILKRKPRALIIGFYDEIFPDERGTQVSDEIRRAHPEARYVANLITSSWLEQSVIESRSFGVLRKARKGDPILHDVIETILDRSINHALIRSKPGRKDLEHTVRFEQITNPEDFYLYSKLRGDVYGDDEILPEANTSGFDIDPHDKNAYHFWGYFQSDGGKKIPVAAFRVIIRKQIPESLEMVKYVVNKVQHGYLSRQLELEPEHYPTVEEVLSQTIPPEKLEYERKFLQYASAGDCIELSRNIVRLDLHGQNLGGLMGRVIMAWLWNQGIYTKAIASCDTELFNMYQGWGAEEHQVGPINVTNVANMMSTVWTLDKSKVNESFASGVERMMQPLSNPGHVIVTPETQHLYRGSR